MQNFNCTSKIVGKKNSIQGVFYMQKCISPIVHLLLLVVPVEEAKLNNRSTINNDNEYIGTWHWWLVHRHNFFCHFLNEGNYARFNERLNHQF